MRCRQPRSSSGGHQLELFARTREPAATPHWNALPEETRQTLTALMTRLLVEHRRCPPAIGRRETADDA